MSKLVEPPTKRSLERWIERELSRKEIARKYQVNPQTVQRWLADYELSQIGPRRPGDVW